ncbi:uncharacterized protein LOC101772923 isoform X2 [Setaria italica]|nr:uncharacterized protein LOC101772923 isoform X2 [Setaria italica]
MEGQMTNTQQNPFNIPSRRDPIERPLIWENFPAGTVNQAVRVIIPYLEDTREPHQVIYFDGWRGLGASAVLKSVAEHPPPHLRNRYDQIIHIDCSRWKSRRALQRTIADKLSLGQDVMDIFDRQDEEEDFSGVDEGSRIEIGDAGRKIHEALHGNSFLVVFHNGSNNMVNLNDFGIPQQTDRWSNIIGKVLWTFRGRLRGIPGMKQTTDREHISPSSESTKPGYQSPTEQEFSNKKSPQTESVDKSHIYLYSYFDYGTSIFWEELVHEEATEIAQYTKRFDITPKVAALCCRYLLLLNAKGIENLDYNWPVHASNYWVCDGIMQEYHQDKAWEVATALHEEMILEDFSSYRFPKFGDTTRWIVATNSNSEEIKPDTTSFFWANRRGSVASLPDNMFQRSEQLHVLKLCLCTFNFSSPPFLYCPNIRFLGLEKCKDQPNKLEENKEEEDEQDRRRIKFFQSLLVLDICYTDWELNSSPNIIERMVTNIREISIKRGRIWNNQGWTWRHLQNIHKLRVIEPTCPWETDNIDEFRDMLKLELLDLSGNSTIQVLPCLSGATSLRTLVLDGCIGVEHIGPESLPPSLETFSFDAKAAEDHNKEAKISCISMTGCTRLVNFRLCGSLPELEELSLSNTSVKTLDLKDEVVQVPCLQRIILLGCMRLRAILWPNDGMPKLRVLCIDTRGGTEAAESKAPHDSFVNKELEESGRASASASASVSVTDLRFLQSLLVASGDAFFWKNAPFNMNLCLSSTSKEKMAPYSTSKLVGSPPQKSLISKSYQTYSDVNFAKATIDHDGSTAHQQFQPLDLHVEIGEGISNTNVITERGISAARSFIKRAKSLLVHDNFSINTVIPESIVTDGNWSGLKWCCIERCPKLDTVFTANYDYGSCFSELETFWAADLLMAHCIWNINIRSGSGWFTGPFRQLRAIYLHLCPRLTFVLQLSWWYYGTGTLSNLETIHIVYCGDVSQVFITSYQEGELEFPKLKHVHLHELPKLHQICAARMFAPKLETIWVRGCWSLKRLPATADRPNSRPAVDCEKDWWAKLQWDGKNAGHHPSLFQPRHSKYYKKTMLRGTVLL